MLSPARRRREGRRKGIGSWRKTARSPTEAAYPDIVGGLSLALAQCFKILHPDLKNPQTQHWDEVRAVFDLLL